MGDSPCYVLMVRPMAGGVSWDWFTKFRKLEVNALRAGLASMPGHHAYSRPGRILQLVRQGPLDLIPFAERIDKGFGAFILSGSSPRSQLLLHCPGLVCTVVYFPDVTSCGGEGRPPASLMWIFTSIMIYAIHQCRAMLMGCFMVAAD